MGRYAGQVLPRCDLSANKRELHSREKAHENRFGVYRPATNTSERKIGQFVTHAVNGGEEFLAKTRKVSAPLKPSDDGYGISIVPQRVIRGKLADAFRHGFEMHRLISELEPQFREGILELQIARVAWLGITPAMRKSRRHMVFEFEQDEAFDKLCAQYEIVDEQLAKSGLRKVIPNSPSNAHMTVIRYGEPGDGMDLSRRHSDRLIEVVEQTRVDNGLDHVRVEPLLVGPTYHVPHPELARRVFAMPERNGQE